MADDLDLAIVDPRRYIVGAEIARGGMGRILAARDRRLGRPVAIKELLIESGDLRARFEREARITAKLQHPAIVNLLEAGTWPGGEPFYVMKLVTGASLDKVIANRPTLEGRLGLLANVIAAADALAYAHSVRIIHRDLKPANILVGDFGETVVIDWGLAKDLAETIDEPDVSSGPYRAAHAETLAGSVMGTPAYIPAEQAQGDAVDERADVYALGAMLYHVLAGAPPYTGKTAEAVLDAVIAGPPPPIDARTPGVPVDLVAIVNKAMARAASDRYPTAKELAHDLKKFQTGQLVGAHHYSTWQLVDRWARRHRAPIAVVAIAVVLFGALGFVSLRRIVDEQARTAQSRRDAQELMTFMLGDVSDKLKPLGRLDLLDDVANKAVAYYDRREDDLTDADRRTRAFARRDLGDVLEAQGHADQALRQYRAAMAIAATLAANEPTNAERHGDVAIDHFRIGDALVALGETTGALAEYRASMAIVKELAANDPTSARRQQNLAVCHDKIGDVLLSQGDAAGALGEHRASLAIAEVLATNDPTNERRQRDVSVDHDRIGDVLLPQGDAAGALAEYRASMAIAETLAMKAPANAERQRDVLVSHDHVGMALVALGDAAGALVEYRAALATAVALATNDPTNADRMRDVAVGHDRVGDVLRAQGDAAGALAELRAATAIATTLAAKDPKNATWQRDLSVSQDELGDALRAQGDAAGALAQYRASMAIATTLADKDPTNAERQRDLSVSHKKVGDVLLERGDPAGARAQYRASMAIATSLADKDPTNPERQRDVSVGHDALGDVLLAQGDAAGALAEYRASMAIAATLAAKDPTNALLQWDLAVSHEEVGDRLLAQRDIAGALVEFQAGLDVAQRVEAKNPTDADVQQKVATLASKVSRCGRSATGTKRGHGTRG